LRSGQAVYWRPAAAVGAAPPHRRGSAVRLVAARRASYFGPAACCDADPDAAVISCSVLLQTLVDYCEQLNRSKFKRLERN